jgi:hypothetical protein
VYSPTKTKRNFFGGFRISKRKKEINKIHEQFFNSDSQANNNTREFFQLL